MACRLLIRTMAPDRQGGPPDTLTVDYRTKDDALDEAARQLDLEKARSRKGASRGTVLLELRIECDDGSAMEDDAIRRVAQFPVINNRAWGLPYMVRQCNIVCFDDPLDRDETTRSKVLLCPAAQIPFTHCKRRPSGIRILSQRLPICRESCHVCFEVRGKE